VAEQTWGDSDRTVRVVVVALTKFGATGVCLTGEQLGFRGLEFFRCKDAFGMELSKLA
jgi:hypothetical protein